MSGFVDYYLGTLGIFLFESARSILIYLNT